MPHSNRQDCPARTSRVRIARSLTRCLVVCVLASMSGCVALGVPSQRMHDPDDHGGLLGDWRRGRPHTAAQHTQSLIEDGAVIVPTDGHGVMCDTTGTVHDGNIGSGVIDGTMPLDLDPITGGVQSEPEKPPEVPWPRFHPVPTRPVFGGGLVADPHAGI
ncbi:hypothetical protein [Rhodopirellula bahusiensis]|uniref:Uncharacterized protein n=1 Tax=Rhodopirellula bahusiensis TaxID=2014065 RepID=A0A2G1W9X0_9BACT|nr:hypothetical protein [Rhodopirellula bahusiensis]PHQ35827.1 hypothetical protein CEE69_08405 [Rhodopirellula bahusiensis]